MTLTKEQEKWITEEFLGRCWHEVETVKEYHDSTLIGVCACGVESEPFKEGDVFWYSSEALFDKIDFTDWRTFGLLMNELDNRWSDEEIAKFLYTLAIEGNPQTFPVRAANYIYELSNGGQP